MKILGKILEFFLAVVVAILLVLALSWLGSCRSVKNSKTETVEKTTDTKRDSVVTTGNTTKKDSAATTVKETRKDSTVVTEPVKTGVKIAHPCDSGKIKPFSYYYEKSNFKFWVASDTSGALSIDVDVSAANAYQSRQLETYKQEYREHYRDSLSNHYERHDYRHDHYIRTTIHTRTTKYRVPLWLIIVAGASVLLNLVPRPTLLRPFTALKKLLLK